MTTDLLIDTSGTTRCLYNEAIPLRYLGRPQIERASHVEPTKQGSWVVDLSPVYGPKLGPYLTRTEALGAETDWLNEHWLT